MSSNPKPPGAERGSSPGETRTPPAKPQEPNVWVIRRHEELGTADLDGPRVSAPVRVLEDLGRDAMLAWAVQQCGDELVKSGSPMRTYFSRCSRLRVEPTSAGLVRALLAARA